MSKDANHSETIWFDLEMAGMCCGCQLSFRISHACVCFSFHPLWVRVCFVTRTNLIHIFLFVFILLWHCIVKHWKLLDIIIVLWSIEVLWCRHDYELKRLWKRWKNPIHIMKNTHRKLLHYKRLHPVSFFSVWTRQKKANRRRKKRNRGR